MDGSGSAGAKPEVRMTPQELSAEGGRRTLGATLFEPTTQPRDARVVVVAGAVGVPQRFYRAFAAGLAVRGFRVLTFDYHGIGASRPAGSLRGLGCDMLTWCQQDLEAVIGHVRSRLASPRVLWVGHSVGGWGLGLAPSCGAVDGMVGVAAQSADVTLWPRRVRPKVHAFWTMLYGAAKLLGFVPARLLGTALPAKVVLQWRRWALTPGFVWAAEPATTTRHYAELQCPVLLLSIERDLWAPRRAVDALGARLGGATIERRHLEDRTLGHVGFFRAQHAPLWTQASEFFEALPIAGVGEPPIRSGA